MPGTKLKAATTWCMCVLCVASLWGARPPEVQRHVGLSDGLTNGYVQSLATDSAGFLWVGTARGLNRFDGTTVNTPAVADTRGQRLFTLEDISALLPDRSSNSLWVGTRFHGLFRLQCADGSVDSVATVADGEPWISSPNISSLHWTADGRLLVTSYWGGLDVIDLHKGTAWHVNSRNYPELTPLHMWDAAELEPNGRIAVATEKGGLLVVDPATERVTQFQHDPRETHSVASGGLRRLLCDTDGNLWIGCFASGLCLMAKDEPGVFRTFCHTAGDSLSLAANSIFDLTLDTKGTLWIATETAGVCHIDPRSVIFNPRSQPRFHNLTLQPQARQLSNKSVYTLMCDTYGNLLCGTWGDGLDIVAQGQQRFDVATTATPRWHLAHSVVIALAQDTQGNVWVGTDGGGIDIFSPDGRKLRNLNSRNTALDDDNIITLWQHPHSGPMYAATYSGRLYTVNADGASHQVQLPVRSPVYALAANDTAGTVWAGSDQGLMTIDSHGMARMHVPPSGGTFAEQMIRCIAPLPRGLMAVGTHGYGLSIFDGRTMKLVAHFSHDTSGTSNFIHHLVVLPYGGGTLLAMTEEGMLEIDLSKEVPALRAVRFGQLQLQSGVAQPPHRLIMGGAQGLYEYDLRSHQLEGFSLQRLGILGDFRPAAAMALGDTALMGSHYGLVSVRPRTLKAPPLHLRFSEIRLKPDDPREEPQIIYPMAEHGPYTFPHNQNSFLVSFSEANPVEAPHLEYFYNIEGLMSPDVWEAATNANSVLLRDLPSGSYRLRVRAGLFGNPSKEEEISLQLRILPPWWLAWWMLTLYGLAAAALTWWIICLYRRRLRRKADQALQQRRQAQTMRLEQERTSFFTNITHELRTPLSLIIAPIEELSAEPSVSPQARHKLQLMRQNAQRLLAMINSILDFRRLESNARPLAVVRRDLAADITDIAERYRQLNGNHKLQIRTDITAGDYVLWYDPEAVATIVDNLMSNALKYTPAGSITLGLRRQQEHVEITVSDTGKGIAPEALPHIFERFFTGPHDPNITSTGIGLWIVKTLVELHKATITVDSQLGKGTTFRLTLRADYDYATATSATSTLAPSLASGDTTTPPPNTVQETETTLPARKTILVVEDNDDMRLYIASALASDYTVIQASNGQQGLAMAKASLPDLILTDIMMPQMDGMEMTAQLHACADTSHIPVVMLTAKTSMETRTEAYTIGAQSFIPKPFTISLLKARLHSVLEREEQLRAAIAASLAISPVAPAQAQVAGTPSQRACVPSAEEAESTAASTARMPSTEPAENDTQKLLEATLNPLDREFMARFQKAIENHLTDETLNVGLLASELAMSYSTLLRKVKALTGTTINMHLRRARLRKAQQLLLDGHHTITEISELAGFGSTSRLRADFRAAYGCSPSEYLKSR